MTEEEIENISKQSIIRKDRLKHLPFNFFWCLTSFLGVFVILNSFANLPLIACVLIAFVTYLIDVRITTDFDCVDDRMERMEKTIEELKNPKS